MITTHVVRPIEPADLPSIGDAAGRAFFDEAVFAWALGDDARRTKFMVPWFTRFVPVLLRGDEHQTALTIDGKAVALWHAPGYWKIPTRKTLGILPLTARYWGVRRVVRLMATMAKIEKRHPTEPHWYLSLLATAPELQRTGMGSALLQPVLDACDRDGIGAYLETQELGNVVYYRRFGFEVREELELTPDITCWLMWRDPR